MERHRDQTFKKTKVPSSGEFKENGVIRHLKFRPEYTPFNYNILFITFKQGWLRGLISPPKKLFM